MWKTGVCLALLSLSIPAWGSDTSDAGISPTSPIPAGTHQLIVVQAPSWSAVTATLQRYVRRGGDSWAAQGTPVDVNVGRNGMAWGRGLHSPGDAGPTKKEGDQRSPAGAFLLGSAFGYGDGLPDGAKGYPYLHLRQGISCIEDSRSKYYNQVIDPAAVTRADWSARDEMLRSDGLFRWGIVVEHNVPDALRGAGSCIFLHIWRGLGRGTAGCTAMAPEAITDLITWLNAADRPVLVQLPQPEYVRLRSGWALP